MAKELQHKVTAAFSSLQADLLMFRKGTIACQRFQIIDKLGAGGIATAWKAFDLDTSRHVALKHLSKEDAPPHHLLRLRQEFEMLSSVSHPNIVRLESGWMQEKDVEFFAIELLSGGSVYERYFSQKRRLSAKRCYRIARQVLAGLDCLHSSNIVHRDLSMTNLMLDNFNQVKIVDFNISQWPQTAEGILEVEKEKFVGTPLYMSPEQHLGAQCDHRSDLYSLAVSLHFLLTLRHPFIGRRRKGECLPGFEDLRVLLLAPHFEKRGHIPLSTLPGDYPEFWDKVFAKALAGDPEKRYQSAKDFADDLGERYRHWLKN